MSTPGRRRRHASYSRQATWCEHDIASSHFGDKDQVEFDVVFEFGTRVARSVAPPASESVLSARVSLGEVLAL